MVWPSLLQQLEGLGLLFILVIFVVLGKQDSDLLHVHMKIVVADFTMSSCTYILQPDKHMLSSSEA